MGMDLSGAGGYFRWTASGWSNVLLLAEHYGWQATGTGPPRGELKAEWDGSYGGNHGALFYARDAVRLAEALARAVEQMPARKPRTLKEVEPEAYANLSSEEGRANLKGFIEFCRAGSFRLY